MITEKVGYKKFHGTTRQQYEQTIEFFDLAFVNIDTDLNIVSKNKLTIVELYYGCKERCKSYAGIGGSFWLATAIEDMSITEETLQDLIKHYSEGK